MIDPIGVTPGTVQGLRVEPQDTAKVVPLQAVRAPEPAVVAETSARETAKAMAAKPPVDFERVQQIKRALQEGRYPLVPAKIADQMIAAQLRWIEEQ
jgi:negative regulator of flagellin synthesis FlgM